MTPLPAYGLLLLTGGRGRRLGGPKHDRLHPSGGTWGGHLVRVFETALGPGPIQVLGHPLPDRPDLPCLGDEGAGPATALTRWARSGGPAADRWWVVACDMVRWTPETLRTWAELARQADPLGACWILGAREGLPQPLGGFLPQALRPDLAASEASRLLDLAQALPSWICPWENAVWEDLDEPGDLAHWREAQGKPAAR